MIDGLQDIEDEILQGIANGTINPESLPLNLYLIMAEKLESEFFKGYGRQWYQIEIESPDYISAQNFRTNIYRFSAAKTFQEVLDLQALIMDERGFFRPFEDFATDARRIYKDYNEAWMQSEWQTARASGQSVAQWQEIEDIKDIYPNLKYQTVGDDVVRPTHRKLDNIVRPVNDRFWDVHMPPNGWRCRCDTISVSADEKVTELDADRRKELLADVDELFRFNPAKKQQVFDDSKHPYFQVPAQYAELKANNFNLPLP